MTDIEKKKLIEELENLRPEHAKFGSSLRPVVEEVDWKYRDTIFEWVVSLLEQKEKETQWIDVEERLPESDDQVLTYDVYENTSIGYYEPDPSLGWQDYDSYRNPITFWQPLPPPPCRLE